MRKKVEMEIEGKKLAVSNLEKVLYPKAGFTKGQVIDYYTRIAPVLLPHLKDRPITLKRCPEGVDGFFFYEKQCPTHRPDWVKTTEVPSHREAGKIDYCVMNDVPALVWAANLADLELHTFLHRAPEIDRPTALAFDLDPGAPADIVLCCKVGLWLRAIFEDLGVQSFAKPPVQRACNCSFRSTDQSVMRKPRASRTPSPSGWNANIQKKLSHARRKLCARGRC